MSLETSSINTIRCLSADVVQGANAGHPGAPIGCAPMAHVLYHDVMHYDPKDPKWPNRDRFILSNGHASALQYTMLHLAGFDLSMDDLKNFRQFESKTPGHPELGETPGIEVTTGPLGQGISNAVGFAIGAEIMAATFNTEEETLFDHHTYVICGDGCLQEGVASEASSLAGTLSLSKLIVLWDDNRITIDGPTDISFTEDVCQRYRAYGWQVLEVEDGDHDAAGIRAALLSAKEDPRPSFIRVHTTIGLGAPLENTAKVHGSPLGAEGIVALKRAHGMPEDKLYHVPGAVTETYQARAKAGAEAHAQWRATLATYAAKYPEKYAQLMARTSGSAPFPSVREAIEAVTVPTPASIATRAASGLVLNAYAAALPQLVGGSADLTGSNKTALKGIAAFSRAERTGRYLQFGVREHAMAAISNGLSAYGGFIPFDATFLVFLGYNLGAIRVGALSKLHALHVYTHDSIGLGTDGPTHQPVETMAYVRATPGMVDWRPADIKETHGAYAAALQQSSQHVFAFSRQSLPTLEGTDPLKTTRGAYIVHKESGPLRLCVVATGSEVAKAVEAADRMPGCRVVSMPSMVTFSAQDIEYQASVIPLYGEAPVLAVEPYTPFGWRRWCHSMLGLDSFGMSAPASEVMEHFHITAQGIIEEGQKLIKKAEKSSPPPLVW